MALFVLPFSSALGCIRDLLLDLSRLLDLALRPFAPVFRCHRETFDTLEAGTCAGSRAWNFSLSSFFCTLTAMCFNEFRQLGKNFHSRVTGSRDPEFSRTLFFTHYITRCSQYFALQFETLHGFHCNLSSIVFSGYAWKRSDVTTSWCIQKAHMKLHSPESPHVCVENDSYELPV